MTIRLLVVSEPGNAGVKRHVIETLQMIDTNRFEAHFIYSLERADGQYENEVARLASRGIQTYEVPMVRHISFFRDTSCYSQIVRLIRRVKPQIVHAHSAKAGCLSRKASRPLWGKQKGPVTIYTPNAMPCYRSAAYHRLEKWAARWTDWIIAVTPSEKQDIVSWGILPEDRVRVIPMGVATIPVEVPPTDGGFVVGGCGRICAQKNTVLFFEAGNRLLASNPTARLVWIGDFSGDTHSQKVKELIARSEYQDRIRVTGWLDEPLKEMAKLSVFCMLSAYESFGFVTADAMAMGIPVIGTKTTGTIDLVKDGETGLLVESDVRSILQALERLQSNRAFCQSLAQGAQELVRSQYAPAACCENLEDFYEEVVSLEGKS